MNKRIDGSWEIHGSNVSDLSGSYCHVVMYWTSEKDAAQAHHVVADVDYNPSIQLTYPTFHLYETDLTVVFHVVVTPTQDAAFYAGAGGFSLGGTITAEYPVCNPKVLAWTKAFRPGEIPNYAAEFGSISPLGQGGDGVGSCSVKNGCVEAGFNLGNTMVHNPAGALSLLIAKLDQEAYSPTQLQYQIPVEAPGTVIIYTNGAHEIHQILTGSTLVDVVTNGTGYDVNFYYPTAAQLASGKGHDNQTPFTPNGNPFVTYQVRDPDQGADQFQLTEVRNGVVFYSSLWFLDGSGNWSFQQKDAGGNVIAGDSESTVTDDDDNRTVISQVFDASGAVISYHDQTFDQSGTLIASRVGLGADQVVTLYHYDGTLLTLKEEFYQGTVISWERTILQDASGAVKQVISPVGNLAMTDVPVQGVYSKSESSMLSSGHVTTIPDSATTLSSYTTTETMPSDGGPVVTAQSVYVVTDAPYPADAVNGWITMTQRYIFSGTGQAGSTISSVFKTQIVDPSVPAELAGKVAFTLNEDGTAKTYQYEVGTFVAASHQFSVGPGGTDLRTTVTHGSPGPIPYVTLQQQEISDITGGIVCQLSNLCTGNATFANLSTILLTNDANGNLIATSRLQGGGARPLYSAVWTNGVKTSEIDEAGVLRSYSNFDSRGNPGQVVRNGVPATDVLPAIPTLTTTLQFDAAGQKVHELSTDGTSTIARAWNYDTAGRLTAETALGADQILVSYGYDFAGRTSTRTFADGTSEVTSRALDGTVSSVVRKDSSGTAIGQVAYTYSSNPDGDGGGFPSVQTKTGTVAGQETVVTTVGNWVRRTLSESRGGQNGSLVHSTQYDGFGRIAGEDFTGLSSSIYSYNNLTSASGVSVPAVQNARPAGSGTRSRASLSYFTQVNGEWYSVNEAWADAAGSMKNLTKQRASWFNGGASDGDGFIAVDTAGNISSDSTVVDRVNSKVTSTTQAAGATNSSVSISRLGLDQSIKPASTQTASIFRYDGFGRQTSAQDGRTGVSTTTAYEAAYGHVASTSATDGTISTSSTLMYYGVAETHPGMLKAKTINGSTTYYDYTATGQLWRVWGATDPLQYDYDDKGRLTGLHTYQSGTFTGAQWPAGAGAGNLTSTSYCAGTDLVWKKTDAANATVVYGYSNAGLPQTRTWARGLVTTNGCNSAGDLTSVSYSDGTPGVSMNYNDLGQRNSITDAGGVHTLTYDALGQLTGDAVTAAGNNNPDALAGITATASYALTGGLPLPGRVQSLQVVTTAGTVLQQTYGYDAATGRLSTAGDGTNLATYGYLPGAESVSTVSLSRGAGGVLTHHRALDNLNRVSSISATNAANTVLESHTWTYQNGLRVKDTLADGTAWAYGYNAQRELTSGSRQFADGLATPVPGYQFQYAFDDAGNRTSTTVNGRTANYTPNPLNQYDRRDVPGNADIVGSVPPAASLSITQDDGNNFGTVLTPAVQSSRFAAQATLPNVAGPVEKQVKVEATVTGGDGLAPDYDSTVTGKLFVPKTPETFQYDADGNLLADGRWTYTWDGENRLSSMLTKQSVINAGVSRVQLAFLYDWRGRRIQKLTFTGNGDPLMRTFRFVYDTEWNLLCEVDESNRSARSCLWGSDLAGGLHSAGGIGGLLVESVRAVPPNDNTVIDYLPYYDGNGNIAGATRAADGTAAAQYEYGPFGEPIRVSEASPPTRVRFSSKYGDQYMALLYFGNRYYHPSLGRWISRDPIAESGGQNIYNMVDGNPIQFVDPLGLFLCEYVKTIKVVNRNPLGPQPPKTTYGNVIDWEITMGYRDCAKDKQGGATLQYWETTGNPVGIPGETDPTPWVTRDTATYPKNVTVLPWNQRDFANDKLGTRREDVIHLHDTPATNLHTKRMLGITLSIIDAPDCMDRFDPTGKRRLIGKQYFVWQTLDDSGSVPVMTVDRDKPQDIYK